MSFTAHAFALWGFAAIFAGGCARGEEAAQSDATADKAAASATLDTVHTDHAGEDEHAGHTLPEAAPRAGAGVVAGDAHGGHAPSQPAPARRSTAQAHAGHTLTPSTGAAPTHRDHAAAGAPAAHPRDHGDHVQPVRETTPHEHPADTGEHAHEGMTSDRAGEHHAGHTPGAATDAMLPGMAGPLGIPMQREASGTAWLPDVSPMYALHSVRGRWMYMLHGVVYVNYIKEGGPRGDEQFGSTNWLMGMAKTGALGGHATLRAMFSAEAATVGRCGYPDLLATGETCRGVPLHDRQHPHDLFMELAGMYERQLSPRTGLQLYGGLAGEPALGPVAYPHRISAISNPMAPISHHWHDATHISFGLLTAGLFGRSWKAEASLFNGREPDEERYNLDLAPLDSYAGRLWWLPNERWAMQVSAGHLKEAEPAVDGHHREDVNRTTASVTYHLPFRQTSLAATTLVWGRNSHHGEQSNAFLLETNLDLGGRHVFFARAEHAEKSGKDLQVFEPPPACIGLCPLNALQPQISNRTFRVQQLTGGYVHQLRPIGDMILSGGTRLSLSLVPRELRTEYGSRTPTGVTLFMSLRARAHRLDAHAGMGH